MARRIPALLLFGIFSFLMTAQFATAQGKGKGHNKDQQQTAQDDGRGVRITFSGHDREIIENYYRDRNSNLPPGLAKRNGNLPPGLQKHLERDGTLPPGLQKRVAPFPEDLERRLPPIPEPGDAGGGYPHCGPTLSANTGYHPRHPAALTGNQDRAGRSGPIATAPSPRS